MSRRGNFGIIIFVVFSLIFLSGFIVFADGVKIIREKEGLIVEPTNKAFNLTNLKPGDSEESILTIINNGDSSIDVSVSLKRVGEKEEIDLFEQLEMTLFYDGKEKFKGKMSKLEREDITLGSIDKKTSKELLATIHLPGPETGNEYEGKKIEFDWVFKAESDESIETGVLPQTGEELPIVTYAIGTLALGAGILILVKKKKLN